MPFDISGETMSNQRIVLDQDVVVTHLQGKMYLVAADGSQRLVAEGDVLPKDAVLLAPEGASFQGGETTFTLGSGERPGDIHASKIKVAKERRKMFTKY